MRENISIKQILKFLANEKINYKFIGDESNLISGYSTLFNYKENTLTFVSTLNDFSDYGKLFLDRKIQLIICGFNEKEYDCFKNVIKVEFPKKVFFNILADFYNGFSGSEEISSDNLEFPSNHVSEKAKIGKNVKVGFGCVIEDGVEIGDNTVIHHNVVLRSGTKVGSNCNIYSGVIIGERGFNPFTLEDGTRDMLKHYGGVLIEDNVDIGENCCIARGAIDDTIIKKGAKLNTMIHLAHNSVIGENTVVTMPTHISGSVKIGRNCHIAAVTIRNQCVIGDGAVLGLGAVVVKDVPAGETVVGNPAKPLIKKR